MNMFSKPLPVVVALLAAVGFPERAVAGDPGSADSTIAVTGSATASVAPDLAIINFGVEVQGNTAAEALATNSEFMVQVIDSVQDTGIGESEISTSQFNIYPVYESRPDKLTGGHKQVLAGYRVSNMVRVETPKLDKVAGIIDAAVGAGVNRVDRVSFALSPDVRERLRNALIEEAVLNARAKAEQALAPLGYGVSGVRQVSLAEHAPPVPMHAGVQRMELAAAAPSQVFASDQDVQTTVNVTFLIEREP